MTGWRLQILSWGERAGGRDRASETPVCGHGAKAQGHDGPDCRKALKPDRRQGMARYLVDRHRVSVRRTCDCVGLALRDSWVKPSSPGPSLLRYIKTGKTSQKTYVGRCNRTLSMAPPVVNLLKRLNNVRECVH